MKKTLMKISLLLVEDEEEARKNISEILKRRVAIFFVAKSAKEAFVIYDKHKPDIIISDIQMPEMNGLQMVEKIKQKHPLVKIIMMTAFTDIDYLIKSIDLQVDGYIVKPIHKIKLLSILEKQSNIICSEKRLKIQEQELIQSKKKYQLLTETLRDVVVRISLSGEITYLSPAIKKFAGYSAADETGHHFSEYFAKKEELKQALKKIEKVLKDKKDGTFEFQYIPVNKKVFPVEVSYTPLIENNEVIAIQLVLRNISERKQAEYDLKASEKKFKDLADLLPQTIYETDINGNITYINKQGYNSFGYSEETIKQGLNALSFIHQNDIPRAKQNIARILSGKTVEDNTYIVIRKDGDTFPVSIYSKPIIIDNKTVGMRGIIIDISNQKKAEEAIHQQNIQLQERNEELDAFSHTVAHDLINPVGTMMGFADLLIDGFNEMSDEKKLYYLDIIIKSGTKTKQIISSLLLFANVRKSEIQTEELYMSDIINESLIRLESIIKDSNAIIIKQKIWPVAMGYAPWIEEVWVNYISNAIKYGGSPPRIEIGYDIGKSKNLPKHMVRFWIRDNGLGISVDDQKRVFNKFERLEQMKIEGHGLGLSIVRRIIEKLGGEVGVESKEGEGSLFYFTIPCKTDSKIKYESKNLMTGSKHDRLRKKIKILIAEDDKPTKIQLSIILQKISEEILYANTGNEAIEICKQNSDIDLVLMNIKIADMNEQNAIKQIRESNKDIIIIVQTDFAFSDNEEKTIEAGCNDFITKPINSKNLMETIVRQLKTKK